MIIESIQGRDAPVSFLRRAVAMAVDEERSIDFDAVQPLGIYRFYYDKNRGKRGNPQEKGRLRWGRKTMYMGTV